jgi:hypothetical protein
VAVENPLRLEGGTTVVTAVGAGTIKVLVDLPNKEISLRV